MQIHTSLSTFSAKNPIVTIGMFDGVHVGHQKIIQQVCAAAEEIQGESVLLSFWPHPQVVFGKTENFKILSTLEEKYRLLELYGLDHCIILPFNLEFSKISAEEYIQTILHKGIHVKKIVIGYDHRYGHKGSGDFTLLKSFEESLGFTVEEISAFTLEEVAVSSTKIRHALQEGNVEKAQTYLGYTYSLEGSVVHGNKIGRTLGFPTANIIPKDSYKIIPEKGVYVAKIEHNKNIYAAVVSVGLNPTIEKNNTELKIEAHILDFSADIYDQNLRVFFMSKLREEQTYASLDELKQAISNDVFLARQYFIEHGL